jgi:hypothetical protein
MSRNGFRSLGLRPSGFDPTRRGESSAFSVGVGLKSVQSNRGINFGLYYRRVGHDSTELAEARADQFRRARWPALRPQTFKVSYKRRNWPRASSQIKNETNENRTSNVQHRIMYSACREPLCRTACREPLCRTACRELLCRTACRELLCRTVYFKKD